MAKLIPIQNPADIATPSERVVAEALCAQFPKDVVVFHSYGKAHHYVACSRAKHLLTVVTVHP